MFLESFNEVVRIRFIFGLSDFVEIVVFSFDRFDLLPVLVDSPGTELSWLPAPGDEPGWQHYLELSFQLVPYVGYAVFVDFFTDEFGEECVGWPFV